MKGTENFKAAIQQYLDERAANDPLFSETLKKPNKNIEDCITYILNTVQKSGCNGFADAEIFNMAVHYYDEDDIKVRPPTNLRNYKVAVNHHVEITEEEKEAAKQKALDKIVAEEAEKLKKKQAPKAAAKKTTIKLPEPSLFD